MDKLLIIHKIIIIEHFCSFERENHGSFYCRINDYIALPLITFFSEEKHGMNDWKRCYLKKDFISIVGCNFLSFLLRPQEVFWSSFCSYVYREKIPKDMRILVRLLFSSSFSFISLQIFFFLQIVNCCGFFF